MSSTKSNPSARPITSVPPNSPRAEDNQGFRRGRAIRSCLECRRRKMRCNRSRPCQNCNRFLRDCVYLPFPEWPSGAPNNPRVEPNLQSPVQGDGRAFPSFDSHHRFGYVQPSPFTNHGSSYEPNTLVKQDRSCDIEADDDVLDVALHIGRLSITEKLGGYLRPHVATQVSTILSLGYNLSPSMPGTPLQQPELCTNNSFCRLRHFYLRQTILWTRTAPKLPMAYQQLSTQATQQRRQPLFWSKEFCLSNPPLAFCQHLRDPIFLSLGLSFQAAMSSCSFTANTGTMWTLLLTLFTDPLLRQNAASTG